MAKRKAAKKKAGKVDALLAPVKGATRRNIGHVQLEVGRAGAARVKRMIYPPGFHWAVDMKPVVGTEPVVLIEFDFEGDTINKLGMPKAHQH